MKAGRGARRLGVLVFFASALLHAQPQFSTSGCPQGQQTQLNGFDPNTPGSSEICLVGTFPPATAYSVTLTRTDTNLSSGPILASVQGTTRLQVTVPISFYGGSNAAVVPVNIIVQPSAGSQQTGSFQINPPLTAGGPVFVFAKGAWIAGVAGLPEKDADLAARTLAAHLD